MYVSDDELARRLTHEDNLANPNTTNLVVAKLHKGGGTIRQTTMEQKAHAVLLMKLMGHRAAASITGYGEQKINDYARGETRHKVDNPVLRQEIRDHLTPIRTKAAGMVLETLGLVKTEDIAKETVKDKVQIADRLMSIVERTSPLGNATQNNTNVSVVFMSPKIRGVDDYEKVS